MSVNIRGCMYQIPSGDDADKWVCKLERYLESQLTEIWSAISDLTQNINDYITNNSRTINNMQKYINILIAGGGSGGVVPGGNTIIEGNGIDITDVYGDKQILVIS